MAIWRPSLTESPGPRARAIADAIGADIASGRLRSGDRLPPQRDLAYALGVSPNTVMRAYAEAARRGHIAGTVGRGTYVRSPDRPSSGPRDGLLSRPTNGPVDLSLNLPFIGEAGHILPATLAELARADELAGFLDRADVEIRGSHLRAGAIWLRRLGHAADPERLLITNGAQHGIFATLLALLKPGDVLLTERLTYAPIKAMARHIGVRIVGIAMDEQGLRPDALKAACRNGAPKALYCTPTLQTPTTAIMSESRRREIARVAAAHELLLIEDDVFGALPASRPAPLTAFAPDRSVLITSVSKSMAPGLRVGYVNAPERLQQAIRAAIELSSWTPAPLMAEIACRWIEQGIGDRLNEEQRLRAIRRQMMARAALVGHPYHTAPESFHIWMPLPDSWSAESFALAASHSGVIVNPAQTFAVGVDAPRAVRICLSHETSDERVTRGLHVLASLLKQRPQESGVV